MQSLSPEVQNLVKRIDDIVKTREKQAFVDESLLATLNSMTGRDLDTLKPPMADGMLSDSGFVQRLAAYLFGVSVETLLDAPARTTYWAGLVATANFTVYMAGTVPR